MTFEFKKATLQEVTAKPSARPQPDSEPVVVQINPASLRLQMSNTVDAGKAFARPNTQYQGSSSSTLSFDLLFDTADEGTTEEPVDVRTRTRQLERFLLPSTKTPKSVPPRVRFTYGTLTVVGVMTSMNQDFDFFAANGVPLRAKCAVTIKEQKPEFDAKLVGPGANTGAGAVPPLPAGTGAGAQAAPGAGAGSAAPAPPSDRTGTALGGESASDFASRMGLDPRAWKGLAGDLTNPLSLDAGLQIDFSSALSLEAGLGVEVGATAGVGGADLAGGGSPQRTGGEPPDSPVPAQLPLDGTALTAAGGLTTALARATAQRTAQAADASRESFGVPPRPGAGGGPGDSGASVPGAPRPAPPQPAGTAPPPAQAAAVQAAAPVSVDPRSVTYGFGVPLRERRRLPRRAAVGLVHERSRTVMPAPADGVPESDDPTVPGWEALPSGASSGTAKDKAGNGGRSCSCGCGGGPR